MIALGLSTRSKIFIAMSLRCVVKVWRGLWRRPMSGIYRRGGVVWALDLNEGIDFAIWLLGAFEHDLRKVYAKRVKAGDVILDLGANIGAHSLPLAKLVGPEGRVVAVEATAYAHEKLKANLALNTDLTGRVLALHAILLAESGGASPSHLHSSWPLNGLEPVDPVLGGALRPVGQARPVSLDQVVEDLGLSRIDWIKLDVDGNELAVLQGARRTLVKFKPRILMELAPYCHVDTPGQFDALIGVLAEAGCRLFTLPALKPLPVDAARLSEIIPRNGSINVLVTWA